MMWLHYHMFDTNHAADFVSYAFGTLSKMNENIN